MSTATVEAVIAATPRAAYDIGGPIDPTRHYPRFGPLPAVVGVIGQTGSWDTPGRTRTLLLSDGGSVVETITDADPPTFFAYELSDFRKLFGMLVKGARAEWRYDRTDAGTRIRWTYSFAARPGRAPVVTLIVRLFWAPYMRRVLPRIAHEIERRAAAPRA
jgi:hypothetical protein